MTQPHPRLVHAVSVVAVGGAVGAVLRWYAGVVVPDGGGFPWTTFAINVSGSCLLALLPVVADGDRRPLVALLLGPGVLGGFTTMSACSDQIRALLATDPLLAFGYLAGTLVACVAAVGAAQALAARE